MWWSEKPGLCYDLKIVFMWVNFYFFILFYFILLYFTLQYCIGFAIHWHDPKHEPPSHLHPHNIPLGHPHAPAPSMLYPASDIDWWFDAYMTVYMPQCHSPKSSHPLPLRVFGCIAGRILVPWPGIKPVPLWWKCAVLTTGPLWKYLSKFLKHSQEPSCVWQPYFHRLC